MVGVTSYDQLLIAIHAMTSGDGDGPGGEGETGLMDWGWVSGNIG